MSSVFLRGISRFFLVGVGPMLGCTGSSSPPDDGSVAAQLLLTGDTIFDAGLVEVGDWIRHDFVLTNRTPEPLVIAKARVSCGCLTVALPSGGVSVHPGSSAAIPVVVDTVREPGLLSVDAALLGPAPRDRVLAKLSVRATLDRREGMQILTPVVDLGIQSFEEPATVPIEVKVFGTDPQRLPNVDLASTHGNPSPDDLHVDRVVRGEAVLESESRYQRLDTLYVVLPADLEPGAFTKQVHVVAKGTSGVYRGLATLRGQVQGILESIERVVSIGGVDPGTEIRAEFPVGVGAEDAVVVTTSVPWASVALERTASGEHVLRVAGRPPEGVVNIDIRVTARDRAGRTQDVDVVGRILRR